MSDYPKKLIEVSIPLQEINEACVREKSIRHGHPSTLHLWWARRPLAAARAVLFAQMVDDPSGYVEELTKDPRAVKVAEKTLGRKHRGDGDLAIEGLVIAAERERLFDLMRELVLWENTTNESLLKRAQTEIKASWQRHLQREGKPLDSPMPPVLDPFAGGGAIPLEAQRLGMEAHASDLNPVAVLINKAMIEIPPKFGGMPPANPDWQAKSDNEKAAVTWKGAQGLAEDVRYYGKWMREEAKKRIGHLYPPYKLTQELLNARPDLVRAGCNDGDELLPIAWLWARTVPSPNPALGGKNVPLISSFWLSKKKGNEAYIQPIVEDGDYRFEIRMGKPALPAEVDAGTKAGRGSNFNCIVSGVPISGDYIKKVGKRGEIRAIIFAVVCDGPRGRVYLPTSTDQEKTANHASPTWAPSGKIPRLTGGSCVPYGMDDFGKLFTPRQLVALTAFADLVTDAREKVLVDAKALGGLAKDTSTLEQGGKGVQAYADAVAVYLALGVSRLSDISNSLCRWEVTKTQVRNLFSRQAIPMLWDFAENNIFGSAAGDYGTSLPTLAKVLDRLGSGTPGTVHQANASTREISPGTIISSDPPYYDNIGYADLSDFFYVWLRKSLQKTLPQTMGSILVPKEEELIASFHRHGSKSAAESFFLDGMTEVAQRWADSAGNAYPTTIYYAFKQSEIESEGVASTGWATFLDALMTAGFSILGTWPMRTELANKIGQKANMLASSIVLVCRHRSTEAQAATRRELVQVLQRDLPAALRDLQHGNIAPVDLPQSSIGPGMAIFSNYSKVIEADGSAMSVRTALQLINAEVSNILEGQVAEMDDWTRFTVNWFASNGFNTGKFGDADNLSKAFNVAVDGVAQAGIVESGQGKVRIYRPNELPADWNPDDDDRLTVWEVVHHLIRLLESRGEEAASKILASRAVDSGNTAENARALCYRLYTICEQNKWADDARAYNGLITAWPELLKLSQTSPASYIQGDLI